MSHIRFYFIIAFLFLMSSLTSKGQDETDLDPPQHGLHVSGATLKFVGMYSVNYERSLLNAQFYKMNMSAGAGGWYLSKISEMAHGYSIPVSFNNLVGNGNNFFEFDVGVRYTFFNKNSIDDLSPVYPILNLGYRHQKQNGKGLIFRAFIGASGIGIGIGKAFRIKPVKKDKR